MRISDWSSDVCSSDLVPAVEAQVRVLALLARIFEKTVAALADDQPAIEPTHADKVRRLAPREVDGALVDRHQAREVLRLEDRPELVPLRRPVPIGRAAWRGRGCRYG